MQITVHLSKDAIDTIRPELLIHFEEGLCVDLDEAESLAVVALAQTALLRELSPTKNLVAFPKAC
jgi:hypothetical protein